MALNISPWIDVRSIAVTSLEGTTSPEYKKFYLICLPYGGGGASLYQQWQKQMPDFIYVLPIQYPGRENRLAEEPITDIKQMITQLEQALTPAFQLPFAIYGHSLGGLIAYRLAHQLCKNNLYKNNFRHLFIGAFPNPALLPNHFLRKCIIQFQSLGFEGIPEKRELELCSIEKIRAILDILRIDPSKHDSIITTREFIMITLTKMLADLKVVASYQHNKNEEKIDVPLTAFFGIKDDRITLEEMQGWKNLTSASFNLHVFPADHFFLDANQMQTTLIRTIINELDFEQD